MRYYENIKILQQLKSGAANSSLLAQYSGWGGLRKAIYTPEVYKQLKSILTDEEINSIKTTMSSAYYTPEYIVNFICSALAKMGVTGGRVLEPAAGIGAFLSDLKMLEPSEVVAVEIDNISCDILKKLHPNVKVVKSAFEKTTLGKFNLICGNPPFGREVITDKADPDLSGMVIHHWFAAKCVRMLSDGGILAMVLPSYFMDNVKDHARDIITRDGGNLLAAFRLPDDLFADAKVTVDIVFIVKGRTANNWQKTEHIRVNGCLMPINEYYMKNKNHILGRLKVIDMYSRKGLTCARTGNIQTALSTLLDSIPNRNTHGTIRPHAQCVSNAHKLEERIATVRSKIGLLQKELGDLLDIKNNVDRLQTQINTMLAQGS